MPEADRHLLEAFVHGDELAFEALFRQFESEVYRWILRIVRNPTTAEDVLVETFWRAYRGRARFDPERSIGAWLRRIATNASIDAVKRAVPERRWMAIDEQVAAPAAASADAGLERSIASAFRRLPPKLGVVATLALVEEVPYADIADALDLPVGTVKSRVSRAMGTLRRELARMGVTP
jgi:RNA polymerase sigma-70 factor (ECF subfamily)